MNRCFIFFLLMTTGIGQSAIASTCLGPSHPCEEFSPEATIFVGKAVAGTNSDQTSEKTNDTEIYFGGMVRFEVIVGFNKAEAGEIIEIQADNPLCWGKRIFPANQPWLIYSHKEEEKLLISCCSRTRPLSEAGYDLQYLSRLHKITGASLYGSVSVSFWNAEKNREESRPVPDISVRINRLASDTRKLSAVEKDKPDDSVHGLNYDNQLETRTDDNGYFLMSGLKPGEYEVEIVPPSAYLFELLPRKVSLCDKCCKEIHFYLKTEDAKLIKSLLAREETSWWESIQRPPILIPMVLLIAAGIVLATLIYLLGAISKDS